MANLETSQKLLDFFLDNTGTAIYLLSGEYLYDRKLVRGFDGLVNLSEDVTVRNQFQSQRLNQINQAISGTLMNLNFSSLNQLEKTIQANSHYAPTAAPDEYKIKFNLKEKVAFFFQHFFF